MQVAAAAAAAARQSHYPLQVHLSLGVQFAMEMLKAKVTIAPRPIRQLACSAPSGC